MNKIPFLLLLFTFFNCSAQNKLNVETILTNFETKTRIDSQGVERRHVDRVPIIAIKQPGIEIKNNDPKNISYEIQGNIASGGLSIKRIKRIRTEEKIIDNIMYIKHYVEIKRIPGKEGARVIGYNFNKLEKLKIQPHIDMIKIELYTAKLYQENITKLISEKEIKLK